TRSRDGAVVADLVVQNGQPVYCAGTTLNDPDALDAFATAALARAAAGTTPPPSVAALVEALPVLVANVLVSLEAGDDGGGRRSQADRLVGYAEPECTALFLDQFGQPHALVGGLAVALTSAAHPWL